MRTLPNGFAWLAPGLVAASIFAQTPTTPPELGKVAFARDLSCLDEKPGKPVFLLFQEIPG